MVRSWRALALGAAIVVLALSLRSGVSSLGVLLPRVRDDLDLSAAATSALPTLPALCFAVVGLGTGRAILRYGVHRVAVALLLLVLAGLAGRALTDAPALFLGATVVAMAGAALGNVVLPPLAKRHFPDHLPLISALYGAALVGGATIAATASVPLADSLDSWRWGLAVWAVFPLLGALLWLPTSFGEHARPVERPDGVRRLTLADVGRTPVGRAMVVCFGVQSATAYVQFGWWGEILTDAGADDSHAGALLGVVTGVGIPVTLALPLLIRATHGSVVLPVVFAVLTVGGWVGVAFAPLALDGWVWAALLGAGGGSFTWVLAMIPARSRTTDGTSQLSALTQGIGYLIASAATFACGLLRDATGSWTLPVLFIAVLAVGIGAAGAVIVRAPPVEDALGAVPAGDR